MDDIHRHILPTDMFDSNLRVARDAAFFKRGIVVFLGTIRIVSDLIIIVLGVIPLLYSLFTTYLHLKAVEIKPGESVWDRLGVQL
jgi:nitric oxide reductase subunit B